MKDVSLQAAQTVDALDDAWRAHAVGAWAWQCSACDVLSFGKREQRVACHNCGEVAEP